MASLVVAALSVLPGVITASDVVAKAAGDGDHQPASANPAFWLGYVDMMAKDEAAQDWSTPEGALVADSGFRPFTDGFSFFNMGVPDQWNNEMFGAPESGPRNLDADTLRSMMGKRVCLEGTDDGACTLSLAGKLWRDAINADMAGGHCYGLAATASRLYAGEVTPGQFQAGATTAYDLALRTPISREIARYMASQYSRSPMGFVASPAEVVEDLKAALVPGKTPPVLIMLSGDGGHAVTPYALYQGEAGRYDVAIYDNNYPDFSRVVRLDTDKQTAQYAFSINPDEPPVDSTLDAIGVVPADFISATQPCPFCRDAQHTNIQIEPVRSQVPLKAKVTDLDGKPMEGLVVTPPTSPWEPGEPWTFPSFQLPKGQAFLLTISARDSKKDIKASVLATTGMYSVGTEEAQIPAGTVGRFGFDTKTGIVVYKSKDPGMGRLAFIDTGDTRSVAVAAHADASNANSAVGGVLMKKRKMAVLYPLSRKGGRVTAQAQLQYFSGGKVHEVAATMEATLPTDGALTISYGKWTRRNPTGLQAFIESDDRRTPVTVRFS